MSKKLPEMNKDKWLDLARSDMMKHRISTHLAMDDFQAIIRFVEPIDALDWDYAVALLHMVYGWMPTMLSPINSHTVTERIKLLDLLNAVKKGSLLDSTQIELVKRFANGSTVGTSKLLHVLKPENYAIWDSRVAKAYLWHKCSRATLEKTDRFIEYLGSLRSWIKLPEVISQCATIRSWHHDLFGVSDLRLIELVLFRANK